MQIRQPVPRGAANNYRPNINANSFVPRQQSASIQQTAPTSLIGNPLQSYRMPYAPATQSFTYAQQQPPPPRPVPLMQQTIPAPPYGLADYLILHQLVVSIVNRCPPPYMHHVSSAPVLNDHGHYPPMGLQQQQQQHAAALRQAPPPYQVPINSHQHPQQLPYQQQQTTRQFY